MITIEQIKKECNQVVNSLVNHGNEVCDNFQCEREKTYFCENCGYSQYIHLAKQIIKAEK